MGSMVMISQHEWMDWVSDKFRYRPGVRGRTVMRNGSSGLSAEMPEPRDRHGRVASPPNSESYFGYYHRSRTHLSLDKDAPESRPVQDLQAGRIIQIPEVGGLHYRYERSAA
jgi:hypothetical protein